eukprot:TRINITY_DN757_c0_g1_i3.p1 TRINITY_DN757_c0_g1~~TRINITY_DN757_c0_g1_i3.p1  ORF type:complete len:382 (+),score=84.55 TRINITY_DN757_c0_g1_i3:54-1199(+)
MDNQTRSTNPNTIPNTQGGGRGRGRGRGRRGGGVVTPGRGGATGGGVYSQYMDDEIRTLFARGLPSDIREREIHNLFRFFAGYEGCILNENPSKQPVAFVSFNSRELALRALRYLQDVRLDLASTTTLRLSFAKSNSKTKRLSPEDLFPAEHNRFTSTLIPPPPSSTSLYGSPSTLVGTLNAPSYYSPHYTQYGASSGYAPVPWMRHNVGTRGSQGTRNQQQQNTTVAPCSTLFVANIHPEVPERDLARLFKVVPGFQRLKMSQKNGLPICFVEYNDVQNSTTALNSFQGFMMGPSPIRIDYARARMAEKRPLPGSTTGGDASKDETHNPDDGTQTNENVPQQGEEDNTTEGCEGEVTGGGEEDDRNESYDYSSVTTNTKI